MVNLNLKDRFQYLFNRGYEMFFLDFLVMVFFTAIGERNNGYGLLIPAFASALYIALRVKLKNKYAKLAHEIYESLTDKHTVKEFIETILKVEILAWHCSQNPLSGSDAFFSFYYQMMKNQGDVNAHIVRAGISPHFITERYEKFKEQKLINFISPAEIYRIIKNFRAHYPGFKPDYIAKILKYTLKIFHAEDTGWIDLQIAKQFSVEQKELNKILKIPIEYELSKFQENFKLHGVFELAKTVENSEMWLFSRFNSTVSIAITKKRPGEIFEAFSGEVYDILKIKDGNVHVKLKSANSRVKTPDSIDYYEDVHDGHILMNYFGLLDEKNVEKYKDKIKSHICTCDKLSEKAIEFFGENYSSWNRG